MHVKNVSLRIACNTVFKKEMLKRNFCAYTHIKTFYPKPIVLCITIHVYHIYQLKHNNLLITFYS